MKRSILSLSLAALIMTPAVTRSEPVGSSFGALMTAQSMAQGRAVLGGRLGVANATSFSTSMGYGFSNSGDGRVKLGVVGDDLTESELVLGADAKWQILKAFEANAQGQPVRTKNPFDLAIGPFVEWFKVDYGVSTMRGSTTVSQLGAQVVGSYPIALKAGGSISPYGRINARNEWLSLEASDATTGTILRDSESGFAVGLNAGAAWRPRSSPIALFGEIQWDGNNGVFFGMDYTLGR